MSAYFLGRSASLGARSALERDTIDSLHHLRVARCPSAKMRVSFVTLVVLEPMMLAWFGARGMMTGVGWGGGWVSEGRRYKGARQGS